MVFTLASSPVRKIFAETWEAFQSKKYWTSLLCFLIGTAYVSGIAVLIWWLFPALKAIMVAKFAVSPPVAHAICWGIKRALRWGFGKIVEAISRKGASEIGNKP